MLEIEKTLVASTCHIAQNELDSLPSLFSSYNCEYGTLIYIGSNIDYYLSDSRLSDELKIMILFAQSNDCSHIKFDSDGVVYEDFKCFDW